MKKWIILTVAIILLIALTLNLLRTWLRMAFNVAYRLFASIEINSRKISQPQNVYEEIWNLLLVEEKMKGLKKTVLTASTEGAEADYDWREGPDSFHYLDIPECQVSLSWEVVNGEQELKFWFAPSSKYGKGKEFIYNRTTNTLYGNTEHSYILENFLEDYFKWCEDSEDFSSDYSMESLGDVTFQYTKDIEDRG